MSHDTETKDQRAGNRQYFVFEEICIVCNVDTFNPLDTIERTGSDLYQAVRLLLNKAAQTSSLFARFRADWPISDPDFFLDLEPQNDRRPGAVLDRPTNQGNTPGTGIMFYGLGLDSSPHDWPVKQRAQLVRDLVLLLDGGFAHKPDGEGVGWQIIGAVPNWLAAAAGEGDSGSPAAPPEPAPYPGDAPHKWTFRFDKSSNTTPVQHDLQELVDAHRGNQGPSDVVVAVLDTSPGRQEVFDAFPTNELFQEVNGTNSTPPGFANRVEIDSIPPGSPLSAFNKVKIVVPDWEGWLLPWFNAQNDDQALEDLRASAYFMSGHGLFVAGVVRDIAADAHIRLARVLDNAGMGSLDVLIAAFIGLPKLLGDGRRHIVVNMSWTSSTISKQDAQTDPLAEFKYQLALLLGITWLGEKNFLVVAAAGNNALDEPARPKARLPAGFDSGVGINNVFSVAATDISVTAPAQYTNHLSDTGVATLGGDAETVKVISSANDPWTEIETETLVPTTLDAVKGIFLPGSLTLDNSKNSTNGWICWVGTSFATPIVSAIAAMVWADHRNFTAYEVIDFIQRHYIGPSVGDLTGGTIFARQVPT